MRYMCVCVCVLRKRKFYHSIEFLTRIREANDDSSDLAHYVNRVIYYS